VEYFSVSLENYLQHFLKAECENKGIEPSIVVAIIERESKFNTFAMGDDGRSFGLMQIQPKWHLQRMMNLGCTDLFHPYQNVTVGIDYLAELCNTYGDIAKALTAYNRGNYSGTITTYATEVMVRASELERGY
jgi:soluble lytic murein transglycosylase-like protein